MSASKSILISLARRAEEIHRLAHGEDLSGPFHERFAAEKTTPGSRRRHPHGLHLLLAETQPAVTPREGEDVGRVRLELRELLE